MEFFALLFFFTRLVASNCWSGIQLLYTLFNRSPLSIPILSCIVFSLFLLQQSLFLHQENRVILTARAQALQAIRQQKNEEISFWEKHNETLPSKTTWLLLSALYLEVEDDTMAQFALQQASLIDPN